jgi:F-type H+-transporting ATPase subunit delta
VLQKLLLLLASRDRIALLPDLLEGYRTRLLDHLRVVRATVTTAVPLADDQAQRVQQSLAALTGRTVQMSTATDPSLMGGVIARIGSTVYDGSIRRQLERLKEELTQ